ALQRVIAADDSAIWSLAFTRDGKTLVAASDMRVQLWDVVAGTLRGTLPNPGGRITRAVVSPDGALLATAASDGEVRMWDLDKATLVRELAVDDDVVWSVAFSPDGRELATANSDEVVALWDVATGRQRAVLTGHAGGATDVAYLGDGATLVAVDRSGQLHLWDAKTGRRLADAWQAHSAASWRVAVHPDGERFATTGDDGSVMVWDELSIAR